MSQMCPVSISLTFGWLFKVHNAIIGVQLEADHVIDETVITRLLTVDEAKLPIWGP